jgi:uncharacterized protein
MPKDYSLEVTPANKQRRPQHVQSDDWVCDFLRRARIGHIATRWEDQPFINPTTFWYDPERHEIYFHSNVVGRVRANTDEHERVCFEASEFGKLLPSNVALEFSIQYESVIAYGTVRQLEDEQDKHHALYGLIDKYFSPMQRGKEYREITDKELKHTSIYAIKIESWSGKRNWDDRADQSDEWPPLGEDWFEKDYWNNVK